MADNLLTKHGVNELCDHIFDLEVIKCGVSIHQYECIKISPKIQYIIDLFKKKFTNYYYKKREKISETHKGNRF